MTAEMEYFIYLLELYAKNKGRTSDAVLKEWDSLKITDFIFSMYERYHIETEENAFEDIDKIIAQKRCEV